YRHYVEISLKGIIAESTSVFGEHADIPRTHNLAGLWRVVRKRLERCAVLGKDWFDRAESLVLELDNLDPDATRLRYPLRRAGDNHVELGFTMSPRRVAEAMSDLSYVLEHLEAYLSALKDFGTNP